GNPLALLEFLPSLLRQRSLRLRASQRTSGRRLFLPGPQANSLTNRCPFDPYATQAGSVGSDHRLSGRWSTSASISTLDFERHSSRIQIRHGRSSRRFSRSYVARGIPASVATTTSRESVPLPLTSSTSPSELTRRCGRPIFVTLTQSTKTSLGRAAYPSS